MIAAIKKWAAVSLGLVYPVNCAVCREPCDATAGIGLCAQCRARLQPLRPPLCQRCGMPYPGNITSPFACSNCANKLFHFDYAVAACRLTGVARECIHQFKYNGALWLGPVLAELFIEVARERIDWSKVDLVVPVPLFPSRQRRRQFNQAEWFARRLVRQLPVPLSSGNLRRVRDTPSQALLNAVERTENMRGAFAVRWPRKFLRQRVILIDDVFTTGATTNECARILKTAGATSVIVLTVGRG